MNRPTDNVQWPDLYPHQQDFIFNAAPYPALWGSWGSGKTWPLVLRSLLLSVDTNIFGNFSGNVGVLGRQVAKDFKDTTLRDLMDLIPSKWIVRYNSQEGFMQLIGMSELNFVHFDKFSIGANLGFAGIDQMEEISLESFDKLIGRARRVRLRGLPDPKTGKQRELKYRSVFGVGNTNGKASWQYERWEANRLKFVRGEKYDPRYWTLPSLTVYDNPSLPPDYIANIEALPPKKFRVYGLGSWESLEGVILEDYSDERCVNSVNVIPMTHWKKYVVIDHGNNSGVKYAGFLAVDSRHNCLLYDEVYGDQITIETFCRAIRQKLMDHEIEMAHNEGRLPRGLERIDLWPCDPSMRRKTEDNASLSIIDLYQQHAARVGYFMPLYAAKAGAGSVDAGNDKMNWLLKNCGSDNLSLPFMAVNPRCEKFRSSAQSYVYDSKTGKPKDGQDDHPIDGVRYGINTVFVGDLVTSETAKQDQMSFAERIIRQMEHSTHPNDMSDYLDSFYAEDMEDYEVEYSYG